MRTMRIRPAPLQGAVQPPPSKSVAHRMLICAALANGESHIQPLCAADDVRATVAGLLALGVRLGTTRDGYVLTGRVPVRTATIHCMESGSTLRFLLPIAAALGCEATFTGEGRLPDRPVDTLTALLRQHGVTCDGDRLPIHLSGRLNGGMYYLPGNVSSQFITGLLLALPLTGEDARIILTTPLESAGYVDLTLSIMAAYGVSVERLKDGYYIEGGQRYQPADSRIEADWSQAAFFLSAGALGGHLVIDGLRSDSVQGDRAALSLFSQFGAAVQQTNGSVLVKPGRLHGIRIDASQIPDLVPALAVTAAFADGMTHIHSAGRLRIKESDRLYTVACNLRAMGVTVFEQPDGLRILGGRPHGAALRGANDHRIVMAFAVGAAYAQGESTITDAQAVDKSYPSFFEVFRQLGGLADEI